MASAQTGAAASAGVPVYVMLPLDTICVRRNEDGSSSSRIQDDLALQVSLCTLKEAGVKVCLVTTSCVCYRCRTQ